MVIVAIEAQDSLRAKYLENAYSVAMSTLAAEAFQEQSTPGASEMLGVKNEDPKQVKRLVFWQCRASKLSVKLSGKNKKHCNTYHPYQTYTQTHIQRQRHRHTDSDTQRAPLPPLSSPPLLHSPLPKLEHLCPASHLVFVLLFICARFRRSASDYGKPTSVSLRMFRNSVFLS